MTVRSSAVADAVLAQVDAGLDQARERLFDLLRIPSISTDPAHAKDVRHAARRLYAVGDRSGMSSRSFKTV
jgi:hypothetical protein